tara:strand:- start:4480 stop:5754 length:1275 start_codon:yes stop_codon:yes gene_type:complete
MNTLTSFSQLLLSNDLLKNLETVGYTTPTPIQSELIPKIFQGQDVLGIAQTGTGKTAAYALPLIDLINNSRRRANMPSCLILVPTRELAEQVTESFKKYGHQYHIRTATLIGGMAQKNQLKSLASGPDVIIATPGRFLDFYEKGKILLANIKFLVIDEADRMLDMGFLADMHQINKLLPKQKQALFLSATMVPSIQKCAEEILTNPTVVKIKPAEKTNQKINQCFIKIEGDALKSDSLKRQMLRNLIVVKKITQAIIFCNRKVDVDVLEKSMRHHGYKVYGFHGDVHQSKRLEYLEAFKKGEVNFLIASDIAARGIDIDGLPHVINYDFPKSSDEYVHRIGRTGRAGVAGQAWTFITAKEQEKGRRVLPDTLNFIDMSLPADQNKESSKANKNRLTAQPEEEVVGFGHSIPKFMQIKIPKSLTE